MAPFPQSGRGLLVAVLWALVLWTPALSYVACRPPTPAEHVRNLKAELAAVKLGCDVYALAPSAPRDDVVTAQCAALTGAR